MAHRIPQRRRCRPWHGVAAFRNRLSESPTVNGLRFESAGLLVGGKIVWRMERDAAMEAQAPLDPLVQGFEVA